jgi:hypothetical protein
LPAGQGKHDVAPGDAAKVPAGHSEHVGENAEAENDPGAQRAHVPPLVDEPAGHEHDRKLPDPDAVKPLVQSHDAGEFASVPALEVELDGHAAHFDDEEL